MKHLYIFAIVFSSLHSFAQKFLWKNVTIDSKSSFRSISVVNNKIAWVGGTKGTLGRSVNGAKTWKFFQVKDFETLDFRSVYAFDSLNVIIANAGSPALILHTIDGGKNWKEVYRNETKEAFIDGIDFWNKDHGAIYGDPINGKMLLAFTVDGGNTWAELPENKRPQLKEGEASFAASGTGIRCYGKKKMVITTGGKVSRLWTSEDAGETWAALEIPILQGIESAGAFSSILWNKKGVIVGGDYKNDSQTGQHVYVTIDKGQHWSLPIRATRGLREAVEYLDDDYLIAVGPQGADLSNDGGINWAALSDEKGFHTVRIAREGALVVAAGNGKIAVITMKEK